MVVITNTIRPSGFT